MDTDQSFVYVKEINHETGVISFAADDRSRREFLPTSTVAMPTNKGMMKAAIGSTCMYDNGDMDRLYATNIWGDF